MTTSTSLKASLFVACMLVATSGFAADKMDKDAYRSAKDKIGADYKAAKAACDSQKGNAHELCEAQAKATQKVAMAQLDYDNTGKDSDRVKLERVKAEQDYAVAKTKCDDMKGAEESACKKEAKATEAKAKADIKAEKKVSAKG